MEPDDPENQVFAAWDSYRRFANSVRHERRFLPTLEQKKFLETIRATIGERTYQFPQGRHFFRAQIGYGWESVSDDAGKVLGEQPAPFGPERMKPLAKKAREGRANPAGIPVLYVANSENTAISEVRPGIDAIISVARLEVVRELSAIDLTRDAGRSSWRDIFLPHLLNQPVSSIEVRKPMSSEDKNRAVWIDIGSAFSQPVERSDDSADYAPTQMMAELFRECGFDAIAYKSQFGGSEGFNVVLFDPDDAKVISVELHKVEEISIEARKME